jgi:hypothetical protein
VASARTPLTLDGFGRLQPAGPVNDLIARIALVTVHRNSTHADEHDTSASENWRGAARHESHRHDLTENR